MRCTICQRETYRSARQRLLLCRHCGKSFDRMNSRDSTTAGLIVWAAQRARLFLRRKLRAASHTDKE